jgi:hypothetical protein
MGKHFHSLASDKKAKLLRQGLSPSATRTTFFLNTAKCEISVPQSA